MKQDNSQALAIALFSEVMAADQAIRSRLGKKLPKGMELSHFSALNYLARNTGEKTPAQIAQAFGVTRGAMTNTLAKLEWAGYVHIRPDWDDARRKLVAISPAGIAAKDEAIRAIAPLLQDALSTNAPEDVRRALPVLRALRDQMVEDD